MGSRYHPDLLTPHDANLCEYLARIANTPASIGAARRYLLAGNRRSTRNSEVIFSAGAAPASHHRRLSVAVRDAYSSSSLLIIFVYQMCGYA